MNGKEDEQWVVEGMKAACTMTLGILCRT